MKKEIIKEIEIPEGVEVKFEEDELIVKGPEGENRRKFEKRIFEIEVKPDKVVLYHKKATKKEKGTPVLCLAVVNKSTQNKIDGVPLRALIRARLI